LKEGHLHLKRAARRSGERGQGGFALKTGKKAVDLEGGGGERRGFYPEKARPGRGEKKKKKKKEKKKQTKQKKKKSSEPSRWFVHHIGRVQRGEDFNQERGQEEFAAWK